MKIALCFIINYNHILNKEHIWREWIDANKHLINVYFYYKDIQLIKSDWILKHCIPENYIFMTSYYHVMPAYLSLIQYALQHDSENEWFCFLTETCCPIIPAEKFKYLFYTHYNKSIIKCKPAWWNVDFHKRANLKTLPAEFRLGNDAWFTLCRKHCNQMLEFLQKHQYLAKKIFDGGLANESYFAIVLKYFNELTSPYVTNSSVDNNSVFHLIYKQPSNYYVNMHSNVADYNNNNNSLMNEKNNVVNESSHLINWDKMSSATSPYLFCSYNKYEQDFIDTALSTNKYFMFIRKVDTKFPDKAIEYYVHKNRLNGYEQKIYFLWNTYYEVAYNSKLMLCLVATVGIFATFYCVFQTTLYDDVQL
jgi:hypothetical protein